MVYFLNKAGGIVTVHQVEKEGPSEQFYTLGELLKDVVVERWGNESAPGVLLGLLNYVIKESVTTPDGKDTDQCRVNAVMEVSLLVGKLHNRCVNQSELEQSLNRVKVALANLPMNERVID
jgi:hypothetical protein